MKNVRFVVLDVHAQTIAVAVADRRGSQESWSDPKPAGVGEQVGEEVGQTRTVASVLRGRPTSYALYWQLRSQVVRCEIVAPTRVPPRPLSAPASPTANEQEHTIYP